MKVVDVHRRAAFADIHGANIQGAQLRTQVFEVPRQRGRNAQPAAERRVQPGLGAEDRHLMVDLPCAKRAPELLDEPGARHCRAGIEQVRSGPCDLHGWASGGDQGVAARQHGRAPGAGAQSGRPQRGLFELTVIGDEFDLPTVRHHVQRQAGRGFDAHGRHGLSKPEAPRQRRLARARSETAGVGATARVDEGRGDAV